MNATRRLFGIAAFTGLLTAFSAFADPSWEGRPIVEVVSAELPPPELEVLLAELGLEKGKPYSAEKLDQKLHEVGSTGKWMRVFVDIAADGKGLRLFVRGSRVRRLRKLEFTAIDEDILEEVKRKVKQDHEQSADLESFTTLKQALKEAYQERGYYFADVRFATTEEGPEEADVEVTVQANAPTRVNKIQVRGGSDELNHDLAELVPVQRGDIFSRRKLSEGVEKINSYLRANQYPTSRVADTSLQFSPDSLEVDVSLLLKLGERFQIRFSGNRVYDDVQLRGLLSDEVLAQTDPSLRISQLVEAKYRNIGYPDCQVVVKRTLIDEGKLNVMELVVTEGARTMIEDLRFSSGEQVGGIDLEELFYEGAPRVIQRKLYSAEGVTEAVIAMQSRLKAMGYLNSRIAEPKVTFSEDRQTVILFFDSDLGVQTILGKAEILGNKSFGYSELQDHFAFKVGRPLNREEISETGKKLLAFYADSGFPEAKLEAAPENAVEISRDQQSAVVQFRIDEGPRYHIGSVSVEGLRKTKAKVVLREMELQSGALYNARKVRQSEENISLLGLFSRVEIIETPRPGEPGVMELRVVVRETRPGLGEVGLGGVYEEPRLRIRPFVGVTYRNVSGLNQTASVRADLGLPVSRVNGKLTVPFVEYSTVLGYRYPWALGLPVTFAGQVGLDRMEVRPAEQTILTRGRVEGRLEKKFGPRITAIYRLIRVERTHTESYLPKDPANNAPITESIGSTGPGIIVDFRDDIFNPRRGSFHSLDIELAHPILFSQSSIAFVLALMRNSFYVPLGPSIGFAFYAGFGYAHSLISGPIARARLVNELSLGGQGSIRGIAPRSLTSPDPLTTKDIAFYNGRAEMNVRLFDDFGVAVFFDSGQIFPGFRATARADGVGMGLRYKTPVGPVVIDFAQGLGALRESVKFYFTVGTI